MTDRTSSIKVGDFTIHTDRDHRGSYRGYQTMTKSWRQWHFHVDSRKYSQQQIVELIETYLLEIHAQSLALPHYAIGNIEPPEYLSAFGLLGKTCVLWISSVTHKLHVEANKSDCTCKALVSKDVLKKILFNKRFRESVVSRKTGIQDGVK